jgi:seryl-tRNA synthetase
VIGLELNEMTLGVVLRTIGPQKPQFPFPIRTHIDLIDLHDLADFESGSRVTSSRFFYLRNELALLELALIQWAVHKLVARGFTPVLPPDIVQQKYIWAAGFQPRDQGEATQVYTLNSSHSNFDIDAPNTLALTGTAEIPIAGMISDREILEKDLPLKIVAFGHAFRTEAGGSGKTHFFGICHRLISLL